MKDLRILKPEDIIMLELSKFGYKDVTLANQQADECPGLPKILLQGISHLGISSHQTAGH